MSAQFWTKILKEVQAGKHGNYAEWARRLDREAFETQTIYYNDIWNAVLDWFDGPDTKLPRNKLSKPVNLRIVFHTERCVKTYLKNLRADAVKMNKVMVSSVSIGGPGSFEVVFAPGATAARQTFNDLRKRRLGELGNKILRRLRNDKQLHLDRGIRVNPDGTGTPYPRKSPGSIFKSSSAIHKQRGLQNRLHGDTE